MIWHRIRLLAARFSYGDRRQVAEMAKRWRKAAHTQPELRNDLLRMGGILTMPPVDAVDGVPFDVPQSPQQVDREAGRRMLALQLLALMGLTVDELNSLMETDDE